MAPPRLSDQQINCGPDWLDADIGGYVTSRNTPLGDYDLAAIAAKLPADQQPEAVVCLVDASWRSTPRNLSAFRCPKILLVADTHHLNTPISGMIRYAQSEAFDRIVLMYDRHHAEFFQAAGLKQLFWFPGLTFPHDDRAVAAARKSAAVESRIAFVGQTGICHPRRIQMLSQLHAHNLPLSVKALSQREGLGFYGSSLVGFNSSLNGDLNLRIFEILASGAMLLTDELAPASGLTDVWQKGRNLVTYASSAELVEKARHAIAHPEESKAIGAAGAKWFDTHFSQQARRTAFRKLAFDGVAPEIFRLPTPSTVPTKSTTADLTTRLTGGYEYVQELHRNLDRVVVALDESLPEDFARHCATLPRVEIKRGPIAKTGRVDVMVIGRQNFNSPALVAATHVWAWEATESERVILVRRCSSMGLALVNDALLIFSRQRVNTHKSMGAVALARLEQGDYVEALGLAKDELVQNPKSVEALIVLCEVTQESGNTELAQSTVAKLRTLAPNHPRLRQILSANDDVVRSRRSTRLLRTASSLLEQKRWSDAHQVAQVVLTLDPASAEAHCLIGLVLSLDRASDQALAYLGRATQLSPDNSRYWHEFGLMLRRHGRLQDALGALLQAANLTPGNFNFQLALGEAAIAAGHGPIAEEALVAADSLQPEHPAVQRWLGRARQLVQQCDYTTPRDLLLSHVEVNELQGTGVFLRRLFPDTRNFITLRSRTLYQGKVDFGGVHFSLDLPGLSAEARDSLVRRILAPYRIRRVLCVPFFASDFIHGITAQELTGAPLCSYVMDDQVLHSRAVPMELAQKLFAKSALRLGISPELSSEYAAAFKCPFGLLPPVVTSRNEEVPNHWTMGRTPANRCAMVGNLWSAKQLEKLRGFVRAVGLQVDWFGNTKAPWLPQDHSALEQDGIFARGFLPTEVEVAQRLAEYPFVLIPSGTLDGSEDNEWLTRLSLPSRMVFVLTQTQTPMMALGHQDTAAARFVNQFGLGASSNYDTAEAKAKIEQITQPVVREQIISRGREIAAAYVFPGAGEWIWSSTEAGLAQAHSTPFSHLFPSELSDRADRSHVGNATNRAGPLTLPQAVERVTAVNSPQPAVLENAGSARVLEQRVPAMAAKLILPRTLNLQPIDVCNSRCVMCNIWKDGTPAKMTLDELKVFLTHPFYAEVTHVGVTGGEPTLRKDLLDIYRLLPECLPKLKGASFITHGMQTDRAVEMFSQAHAEYSQRKLTFEGMVSLDGVGAVHDKVRGRANAFESASRTLLTLKSRGVPVMAACTIVRSNVYELHDLLDWGKANGIYVRFRVAEFIKRLYNDSSAPEIRSFTQRELRHLVSFFHVLLTDYEKNETIKKTYRSIVSLLTGGKRLIGCPYKRGMAVNAGSQGGLASCAPKGSTFDMPADPFEVHAALEESRAEVAKNHCATCIHDYHDEWNTVALEEVRQAGARGRELYGVADEQLTTPEASAEPLNLAGMKQILLAGWYGTETAGDIAILHGIISEYLAQNSQLRFQVLSLYPYYTRTTVAEWSKELQARIDVIDYVSEAAWQATVSCDAVVMAGGPLMDIGETRQILCLFKRFADLRKPRVIEGCGVGPLHNPDFRWNVCRIARLATRISVRDHASRDYLRLLAIEKDIEVRNDPAVTFLRSLGVRHHGSGAKIIRCFLRELTAEYPQALTPDQAKANLVKFLKRLLTWYPEHRVELWAMHHFPVGNDDRLFARQLVNEIANPRLICDWEPRTPAEICEGMAAADFCVCMRFHSCVFATEVGVPFMAIDYTVGGKIKAFLEDGRQQHRLCTLSALAKLEMGEFTARLRTAEAAQLPSRGEHTALDVQARVLHVVQSVSGGGGARAAIWLAKYSRRLGGPEHRVVSLAPADAVGLEVAKQNGIEILNHPTWPELREAMAAAEIVLVHWWNHPDMAALFRRELPPMRLALWLHVAGYHAPQVLTPALIDFADLTVACSPYTYEHPVFGSLPENVRNERTAMVLAGTDFERLHGITSREHNGFQVGYIGTVDRVKMHADFVAMSSAVRVPDVKFIVCGNGGTEWLTKQTKKLGSHARFEFRSPVEDIRAVLETLDVYGYPLCAETYAAAELNLQEVMFAGVPVVAFPHGGIKRLIVHGETGLLVNTPKEYAEAIEYLHQHPEERARLAANAAAFARQHWGAENAAREFNTHFTRLVAQSKRQRRWGAAQDSSVAHDKRRELAIYPGTRLFVESLGAESALFVASITAARVEERIRADDAIGEQSSLMRYNGILPYRDAWPRDPYLQMWAGLGYTRNGNFKDALNAFTQARQNGLSDWRMRWYLSRALAHVGRSADAVVELREVVRSVPSFTPALELQRRLGGGGSMVLNPARSASPADFVLGQVKQAERLIQQGKAIKARECLQSALDVMPTQAVLMEVVAELDCRLGNLPTARRLYEGILKVDPKRATPRLKAIELALGVRKRDGVQKESAPKTSLAGTASSPRVAEVSDESDQALGLLKTT